MEQCQHEYMITEFDESESIPYVVAYYCEDCGADFIDTLTNDELVALQEDALADREDQAYEEYRDRFNISVEN